MEIGKVKDYLEQQIKYQQFLTSKLSKYLAGFDYADKILTIFLTVFLVQTFLPMLQEKKNYLD